MFQFSVSNADDASNETTSAYLFFFAFLMSSTTFSTAFIVDCPARNPY
jgi:hypothetical protein